MFVLWSSPYHTNSNIRVWLRKQPNNTRIPDLFIPLRSGFHWRQHQRVFLSRQYSDHGIWNNKRADSEMCAARHAVLCTLNSQSECFCSLERYYCKMWDCLDDSFNNLVVTSSPDLSSSSNISHISNKSCKSRKEGGLVGASLITVSVAS